MLDMQFSVSPEIDGAAAGDLHKVAHATGGHRLPNEFQVSVFVPLALADRGFDRRG